MNIFRLGSPFMNFMSRVADIIVLGIVVALCCLPVVTVGAAFAALYYVTLKMVRGKVESNLGQIMSLYFKGFKENFWKATALWAIIAAVASLLIIDFNLLTQLELSNEGAVWIVLIIISVLSAMVASYLLPLQAQFENPVGRTVKNAFILSIMNLPRSLYILFIKVCPILVAFFYPEAMYVLGILCIAGLPYLETELFVKVFDKYIPDEDDDGEEDEDEDEDDGDSACTVEPTPIFTSDEDICDEEQTGNN